MLDKDHIMLSILVEILNQDRPGHHETCAFWNFEPGFGLKNIIGFLPGAFEIPVLEQSIIASVCFIAET